jgi:hypothetical protein
MKTRAVRRSAMSILFVLCAAGTATAQSWVRAANWDNVSGSNPSTVAGQQVWSYEYVNAPNNGGGNADGTPWYLLPRNSMSWDNDWYGSGRRAFAKGDDTSPAIFQNFLTHQVSNEFYDSVPVIRWLNPTNNTFPNVDVVGNLRVRWTGPDGVGSPNSVDVVIAKINSSLGTTSVLFSDMVDKPSPFPSAGESVTLNINLRGVQIGAGDSILISHRARTAYANPGNWIDLVDGVAITAVPAPGVASILALAGLASFRRRR